MATAVGLGAGPVEQGGSAAHDGSKRWFALFLALAAGWGMFFGYSAMFLTEDMPFRPQVNAAVPETPAFGFPPMRHALSAAPSVAPALEAQPPDAKVDRVSSAVAAPAVAATPAPAAAPVVAPAPAPAAPRADRAEYVGTWGPNEAACGARSRRRGYIPATITPERASAGRTICSFHDGRRSGNAWVMAADCSDRGRRWSSQVRLVVDGDRLTWTSGKGSSSYVRCGRRAG